MSAICTINKEVYVQSPRPHVATTASLSYIGTGLRRQETRADVSSSDWSDNRRTRFSDDNGHTWSDWETVYLTAPEKEGFVQSGGPGQGGTGPLDPISGRLVKRVFQRIIRGDPREAMSVLWKGDRRFADHGFYQLSADNGKTWDSGHMLRYEEGSDFDPDDWGNPDFFRSNEMYIGGICVPSNGTVVISATVPVPYRDEEDEKTPVVFPNTYREGCVAGVMCFVGTWNESTGDYDWQTSNKIFLPRQVSTRGLVELDLSELSNGNLMLIMRGSNAGLDPVECPARKWMSLSRDGGLTWSRITDLRYDTGEQFYSPATFAKTLRSSVTGKLYCFLNITPEPAKANGPRYPLVVAEVDEDGPSLKKDSVTIVDRRDPDSDSKHLQLTNFGLLEDREDNHVELYLTRLGERGPAPDMWSADTYRYTINFA